MYNSTLYLNFPRTNKLDPRLNFTRTSSATYINNDGIVTSANTNEPRIEYDSYSGEALGLLIEIASTNLTANSANIAKTNWIIGNGNSNVSIVNITAPDNSTPVCKLIPNTSNNFHFINSQNFNITQGLYYNFSVYAKPAEYPFILLQSGGTWSTGTNPYAVFNLANTANVAVYNGLTVANTYVKLLANNWCRCSITVTSNVTASNGQFLIYTQNTNSVSAYSGDNTSGIYVWGAQIEQATFASSYIPTLNSSVTRSADVCSITGGNFSNFYRPDQGTVICEFNTYPTTIGYIRVPYSFTDQTSNEIMYATIADTTLATFATNLIHAGISQITTMGSNTSYININNRTVSSYAANNFYESVNGTTVRSNTNAQLCIPNSLYFGYILTPQFNGYISKFIYYPYQLTANQVQTIAVNS